MTAAAQPPPVTMFASLHVRNYRLYFAGQSISVAGNWMQNIAIGWLVLELTGSGTMLGLVTAARFLPLVALGPWGGLVVDRIDTRLMMIWTQAITAGLTGAFAVLSWLDALNPPVLVAVMFALGLVNVLDGPARQSMISRIVEPEHLANAIALNSIAMNAARILGPAVGGGLIAALGVTVCFALNAASFVPVVLSLVLMRASEMVATQREVRAPGQIRAGLAYVASTPAVFWPMLMVLFTGILTWEFPVTLPLITTTTFGQAASGYGTAMAFLGIGAIGGGLIAARRRTVTIRSLATSCALWGVAIIVASLAPSLVTELIALVLVGSGSMTFNSGAKTLLQLATEPRLRGRVMGIWQIAWQGSALVGAPIVGAIGAHLGPRYALATGGVTALVIGGLVLAMRTRARPGSHLPPSRPPTATSTPSPTTKASSNGKGPHLRPGDELRDVHARPVPHGPARRPPGARQHGGRADQRQRRARRRGEEVAHVVAHRPR